MPPYSTRACHPIKLTAAAQFESGKPSPTHISQAPSTVQVHLPSTTRAGSSQYRSENDPTLKQEKPLQLIDTPGHGKLRHYAREYLQDPPPGLKGIIFVIDAANVSSDSSSSANETLQDAAEYLHDILLLLQKRYTSAKTSKGPKELPVLIAANKLDLFTALPAPLLKGKLEQEISRVRDARAKGLMAAGMGEEGSEERDWLGEGGESKFEFRMMEEVNCPVKVVGGNVLGAEGSDVDGWWGWIAGWL